VAERLQTGVVERLQRPCSRTTNGARFCELADSRDADTLGPKGTLRPLVRACAFPPTQEEAGEVCWERDLTDDAVARDPGSQAAVRFEVGASGALKA
jgi:hypothetical protein